MRLLIDQDIYKITMDHLREWGHDLLTAKELGLQQASDEDLLKRAQVENRLLITRDKEDLVPGIGNSVFVFTNPDPVSLYTDYILQRP